MPVCKLLYHSIRATYIALPTILFCLGAADGDKSLRRTMHRAVPTPSQRLPGCLLHKSQGRGAKEGCCEYLKSTLLKSTSEAKKISKASGVTQPSVVFIPRKQLEKDIIDRFDASVVHCIH